MKIVVFKKDEDRTPHLVHDEPNPYEVELGLVDYPDTPMDYLVRVSEIEYLEEGSQEYLKAYEFITSSL